MRNGMILIVFAFIGHGAEGQELRLGVGLAESDHELLGSPRSLEAAIGTRITSRLGVRLGFQYGRDDFASNGSTCVGLVAPSEDCGPELRREEATTTAWFVGLPVTQSLGWGHVSLVTTFRRLRMKSRQEGTASGRRRDAEKVAYGLGLGVEGEVYLWSRPAIALHLGAHLASHPWFERVIIADGYTPFEESTRLTWLEVGVTAALGAREPAP